MAKTPENDPPEAEKSTSASIDVADEAQRDEREVGLRRHLSEYPTPASGHPYILQARPLVPAVLNRALRQVPRLARSMFRLQTPLKASAPETRCIFPLHAAARQCGAHQFQSDPFGDQRQAVRCADERDQTEPRPSDPSKRPVVAKRQPIAFKLLRVGRDGLSVLLTPKPVPLEFCGLRNRSFSKARHIQSQVTGSFSNIRVKRQIHFNAPHINPIEDTYSTGVYVERK